MKTKSKKYIDKLINSLDKQCKTSKEHNDQFRSVFANNRNVAGFNDTLKGLMFTLIIKRSKGAHIYDLDGNKYLDLTMGFGVHLFGHSPQFLKTVLNKQIEKGISLGPLYADAAEVAQLIHELTGVERSAFFNSGTEAVMVALRLAKAATNKSKIVIFSGSYHGSFDSLLTLKSDLNTNQAVNHIPGITKNILADTVILKYGSPMTLNYIKQNSSNIAAVLVEPVQSRKPELQPGKFLVDIRAICCENNVALIFDEILTGFRIGNGGAMAHFGVVPDLVTFGKVVGGGMPIGIVSGKSKFMNYIDGGLWNFNDLSTPQSKTTFVAGTFCHHPTSMASAKAVLEYLKQNPSIQENLNKSTRGLCRRLNRFFNQNNYPITMDSFGSLFRFNLKGNARYLFYGLLNEGIYIWEGRTCFLSTAHNPADVNFLVEKVKKVSHQLNSAGLLSIQMKELNTSNSLLSLSPNST